MSPSLKILGFTLSPLPPRLGLFRGLEYTRPHYNRTGCSASPPSPWRLARLDQLRYHSLALLILPPANARGGRGNHSCVSPAPKVLADRF